MSEWTDEKRAQVVKMYQDREPTPENSMEIVKEIAEEVGASANGVRMILSKEGVYIKKETPASTKSSSKSSSGATRVSKEDAHNRLIAAIGEGSDTEIISIITGKAALYLEEVLESRTTAE
jgi:transposase-like protein